MALTSGFFGGLGGFRGGLFQNTSYSFKIMSFKNKV